MKIFVKVSHIFNVVGINSNQNCPFSSKYFLSLFLYGQILISTMVFFFAEAEQLHDYAYCFYAIATFLGTSISTFLCLWRMKSLFELITDMENFIKKSLFKKFIYTCFRLIFECFSKIIYFDFKTISEKFVRSESENLLARPIYEKVNEKVEKWSHIFNFVFVKLTLPANVIPSIVFTTVHYFATDLGDNAFLLPFPAS